MKGKRIPKILSSLIVAMVLMNLINVGVWAKIIENYFPGIREIVVFEEATIMRDKTIENTINLPFNAESITFEYSIDRDSDVILSINGNLYNITLPKDKVEYTYKFDEVMRRCDVSFKLTAMQKTQIKQVKVNKVQISWYAPYLKTLPALTEHEELIYTSVIIDKHSPVLLINDATRYINYENIDEIPLLENGRLYMPVGTLARAFGMYYEDYPDLSYTLMRMDSDYELCARDGYTYFEVGGINGERTAVDNPFVYKDGKTYANVRAVSELLGKTVLYKDGIVVIDDSAVRANNIISSDKDMSEINTYLKSFIRTHSGRVYYVAQTQNASDDNPGTEDRPFRTLKKAGDTAKAGDTVIIRGGTYREAFIPKNSGTPEAPIIYRAAAGENVVISAFEEISGFADFDSKKLNLGNLWVAKTDIDLGYDSNFVIYNGEPIIQGRHPNVQTAPEPYPWPDDVTSPLWPTKGDLKVGGKEFMKDGKIYSPNDLDFEDDYWKGALFVGMIEEGWTISHAKIKSSAKGSITVDRSTLGHWSDIYSKNFGVFPNDYGYITGSIKTLDTSGEWHYQDGMLYVYPLDNIKVEDFTVEMKARMVTVDLSEKKFIQLKDINTAGGGINMKNSEMCVLNGGTHKYLSHFIYAQDEQASVNDGFEKMGTAAYYTKDDKDCEMERGELGICISGDNNAVINTEIDYSAAAGIVLYGTHTYVENNVINDTGYGGTYINGISIYSIGWEPKETPRGGHSIYNNTINNTGRAAIYISSQGFHSTDTYMDNAEADRSAYLPNEIAFNYLYNTNLAGRDSGAAYFHGTNAGNDMYYTRYHNNILCNIQGNDNHTDYYQEFRNEAYFYNDAWTAGINLYDNVGFATNERQQNCSRLVTVFGGEWADHIDIGTNLIKGIIPGGKEAMAVSDFPHSKPFYAGAFAGKERFMLNYQGEKVKSYDYDITDAKLIGNAYKDHGMINLPDYESMIELNNVEFKGGTHWLRLFFAGDKYNDPSVEVRVGETYDTAKVFNLKLTSYGHTLNQIQGEEGYEVSAKGTQNMWIRKTAGGSFKFAGFNFEKDPLYDYQPDDYLLGYTFVDYEYGEGGESEPGKQIVRYPNKMQWLTAGSAISTWNNTLYYENVPLTQPFDKLEIVTASGGKYVGSTITLYADSIDTEPICTITPRYSTFNEEWHDEVVLDKMYDLAGHTIIVKFYREDAGGSMNFKYIKFINTGAADKPLVTGGGAAAKTEYLATEASAVGNTSAAEEYVTLENGAQLNFKDVDFKGRAYCVKMKYSLEDNTQLEFIAGEDAEGAQPITVNIESGDNNTKAQTKEIKIYANEMKNLCIKNIGSSKINIYGFDVVRSSKYGFENTLYGSMMSSFEKGSCSTEPHIKENYIYDTWDNTIFFDDINIESDFNSVLLRCTSGGTFTGSTVKVYMDDANTPLFTQKIDTVNWDNDPTIHNIKLDKTYPAGYHSFKVVFDGKDTKSCNFHYIKFEMAE